ncbi:MAG: 5'-methylthioadenosine/adenosylhomocysteine nucleosidase [Clostridia bacterium]|nr:5'-methylthioadenosine/adenosylhomocysteine nucleosidase [Clostridia bacterium]
MKNRIGIIGAMDIEVETLKNSLENPKKSKFAEMEFYEGRLEGKEVIVVKCGIGKVNAGRCAQILCDKFDVAVIVNTGIGGGIGDGLAVSDVVIGNELCQHDFDVTGFGYAKGYMFKGDKDKATIYECDKNLVEIVKKAAEENMSPDKIKVGRIATGDVFVSSAEKKKEIRDNFRAMVCEMEGGAIAQTAVANEIPFVVVRTISDLADGSAAESYEEFETKTAHLCAKIIKSFVKYID